MATVQRVSRLIAVLVLLQMAGGILVNFVLLEPATAAPGFLVNAAGHATEVGLAALLGLAAGATWIAIAIAAWPMFRALSLTMALWYAALALASFVLAAVEQTTVLSMLSLSQYAATNPGDPVMFQALSRVVAAARNWAHYIRIVVDGVTAVVFYTVLLRFALVTRAHAALGVAAALLLLVAITRVILGNDMDFRLLAPMAVAQLAVVLWLLIRGFAERQT